MKVYGDYHTHTTYSDAKCTPKELIKAACDIGLQEIAITDHGMGKTNFYPMMNKKGFYKSKQELEELKNEFEKINILHGVEANIVALDGSIDVDEDVFKDIEIFVCGYHRFARAKYFKEFFQYNFPNSIHIKNSKLIQRNTIAFVNAIEKYPIDILSHINSHAKVDAYKIGKVCAKMGTLIEINERHIDDIEPCIEELLASEVNFILNTDAHKTDKVGVFAKSIDFIGKCSIPRERIVNIDLKKPEFVRSIERLKK